MRDPNYEFKVEKDERDCQMERYEHISAVRWRDEEDYVALLRASMRWREMRESRFFFTLGFGDKYQVLKHIIN